MDDEEIRDEGQSETDKLLDLIFDDVSLLYTIVLKTIDNIIKEYFKAFKTKDTIKQKMLKAGEIDQKTYNEWRKQQMFMGQRWKDMSSAISQDLTNAHDIAKSIVDGYMPDAYAMGVSYGQYQIDTQLINDFNVQFNANVSYTLYDRDTVERILRENPQILPNLNPLSKTAQAIADGKIQAWEYKQLQSEILQGILIGESNDQIADRLQNLTQQDLKAVTRYARTATTAAENAGRIESYKRAESMGIEMEQQWLATLDNRTRHSHRQLDGERVKVGEVFSNGCRFPGDPEGKPGEIWNCRCSLISYLTGIPELEESQDLTNLSNREAEKLNGMSYADWKKGHGVSEPILKARQIGEARRKKYIKEYQDAAKRLKDVKI